MNLLLLEPGDLLAPDRACISGRRFDQVREVIRGGVGDELKVGLLGGAMGRGRILRLEAELLELEFQLGEAPPPKLPLTLLLALPRPKVLNRVIASATSLGIGHIVLLNAWKVEKAYWKSPRMSEENLRHQRILGLEQARDTVLPTLSLARLFRPFVEDELPRLLEGRRGLVAHPGSPRPCPMGLTGAALLAVGPEGGWIDAEMDSLCRAGLEPVDLGPRILRVETAVASLTGRLFG